MQLETSQSIFLDPMTNGKDLRRAVNCLVVVVPVVEKYRHSRTVAMDRIGAEGGEEDEGVSSVVVVAGAVATAGEDRTGVVLGVGDVSPGEDAVVSA